MDYKYVIVGGGMAADAAAKSLRKADPEGSILLISAEAEAPYRRPALSKGLWSGGDVTKLGLRTAERGVDMILGEEVVALALGPRCLRLASGKAVGYQRLLLATGARAKSLPVLPPGGPILAYRDLADFRTASAVAGPGKRVLVIGGGFIGSELAASLTNTGAEVHMAFPEPAICALRFPAELAEAVTEDYSRRGVEVHASTSVVAAGREHDRVSVTFAGGGTELYDIVATGVGTLPNDELARDAGLAVADGIVVDQHLRAIQAGSTESGSDDGQASPYVYAAGDVASYPWPQPFQRGRIEHEDNAVSMGAHAARQMVASTRGEKAEPSDDLLTSYGHFPFFYSDLFDNGYEAVGTLDASLETVVDWREPSSEGVVYYLRDGSLVGVLLWNTWGQVDAARDLIFASPPVSRSELVGRLPQ